MQQMSAMMSKKITLPVNSRARFLGGFGNVAGGNTAEAMTTLRRAIRFRKAHYENSSMVWQSLQQARLLQNLQALKSLETLNSLQAMQRNLRRNSQAFLSYNFKPNQQTILTSFPTTQLSSLELNPLNALSLNIKMPVDAPAMCTLKEQHPQIYSEHSKMTPVYANLKRMSHSSTFGFDSSSMASVTSSATLVSMPQAKRARRLKKRCTIAGCMKFAQGGTMLCVAHGGGKRCQIESCKNGARGTTLLCIRHGGGNRCREAGCSRSAVGGTRNCVRHGGVSLPFPFPFPPLLFSCFLHAASCLLTFMFLRGNDVASMVAINLRKDEPVSVFAMEV